MIIRCFAARWLCAGVLFGLAIASSGCMSYRTGTLPTAELHQPLSSSQEKPSAFFKVSCETRFFNETALHDNVAAAQHFRGLLAEVLKENAAFKSYTFTEKRGTNADMQIALELQSEEKAVPFAVVLSGCSLGVIPVTGTETHSLITRVMDKSGKVVGSYEATDSMRTWFHILLLPFSPLKSPSRVQKELLENLMRTSLAWMEKDGLLTFQK
jgi:hypothetical protein